MTRLPEDRRSRLPSVCRRFVPIIPIMIPLLLVGLLHAETPRAERGGKVHQLFDGKTLRNWKVTDFGSQGEVRVDEGKLVLGMGEPLTGITWTGPEIPRVNYEISLEAQRVDGNDFFCGLTFPVQENPCTLVLGGWGGGVVGLSSIDGFDASENETTDYYAFDAGKWYKVRLRVTQEKIEAWLDEKQIADVDYSDRNISIRIEMELCRPLGLCTFQTVGAVRNFQLRELAGDGK